MGEGSLERAMNDFRETIDRGGSSCHCSSKKRGNDTLDGSRNLDPFMKSDESRSRQPTNRHVGHGC